MEVEQMLYDEIKSLREDIKSLKESLSSLKLKMYTLAMVFGVSGGILSKILPLL